VLGKIHKLSKEYKPKHKRFDYFEKYNNEYINKLIPDKYLELKLAITKRFEMFSFLPKDIDKYGLIHFDFSDGNYHIDMNTGEITVFDLDNSMYCWYMYDLANLWIHGVGWFQSETDMVKRKKYMDEYFEMVLNGYRSETNVDDFILKKLPLFIDMVLIENIVDCFECAIRSNTEIDDDDINDNAYCLINDILYAGIIS
jgi:Ser/Thr protein kinase RdoA (MazF antagonist)